MNELTTVIILIVLVLSFFLHYESKYSELTYVVSTIDNKPYLVRNREDKLQAFCGSVFFSSFCSVG